MSLSPILATTKFSTPAKGLYKPSGLTNFFNVRDSFAALSMAFPFGVLFGGDSNYYGYGSVAPAQASMPQLVRRAMQAIYNAGGRGGEGMIALFDSSQGRITAEADWTLEGSVNDCFEPGYCRNAVNNSVQRFRVTFDPLKYPGPYFQQGLSGFEMIYNKYASQSTVTFDVDTGAAYVAPGAGNVGTVNVALTTGAGATSDFDFHGGLVVLGSNAAPNPAVRNTVQVARAAAQGTANAYFKGMYAYNGDEYGGFHSANLSLNGTSLKDVGSGGLLTSGGSTTVKTNALQTMKTFCAQCQPTNMTRTTRLTGSQGMNLVSWNFILNDWVGLVSPANFTAYIQAAVDGITAVLPNVCFLLEVTHTPTDGTATTAQYNALHDAVLAAADSRSNVSVCSQLLRWGYLDHTTFANYGWFVSGAGSALHSGDLGTMVRAQTFLECLLYSGG